jgi:hypothetical protein
VESPHPSGGRVGRQGSGDVLRIDIWVFRRARQTTLSGVEISALDRTAITTERTTVDKGALAVGMYRLTLGQMSRARSGTGSTQMGR